MYRVETEQETDGRWIAEVAGMPGVLAYGNSREDAVRNVKTLALICSAECVDRVESSPGNLLLIAEHNGCHFEIQRRPEGFYVWRFVGSETRSTHDHLQDDLAEAKRCALSTWGVPQEAWTPASHQRRSRLARP